MAAQAKVISLDDARKKISASKKGRLLAWDPELRTPDGKPLRFMLRAFMDYIDWRNGNGRGLFASAKTLRAETGLDPKTFAKMVSELEEMKLIVIRRKKGRAHLIYLNDGSAPNSMVKNDETSTKIGGGSTSTKIGGTPTPKLDDEHLHEHTPCKGSVCSSETAKNTNCERVLALDDECRWCVFAVQAGCWERANQTSTNFGEGSSSEIPPFTGGIIAVEFDLADAKLCAKMNGWDFWIDQTITRGQARGMMEDRDNARRLLCYARFIFRAKAKKAGTPKFIMENWDRSAEHVTNAADDIVVGAGGVVMTRREYWAIRRDAEE